VPGQALKAPVPGGGTVHDLARRVIDIASGGLNRRAQLNSIGDNESGFLDPLNEIVATGKTPADRLLDLYNGPWQGDLSRIYSEMSF
jgi:glutamate--cysteine ligase